MIKLTKEMIDNCFINCTKQSKYWGRLYRIAFSNWNKIKKISGFPKVSKKTNEYLFHKCIVFDGVNHPEVMSGGLWLDKGFGTNEDLENWNIDISGIEVLLK